MRASIQCGFSLGGHSDELVISNLLAAAALVLMPCICLAQEFSAVVIYLLVPATQGVKAARPPGVQTKNSCEQRPVAPRIARAHAPDSAQRRCESHDGRAESIAKVLPGTRRSPCGVLPYSRRRERVS